MYRVILLVLAATLAVAAPTTNNACQIIDSRLPGRISYTGSTTYNSSISSYYCDIERELHPSCIFRPNSTSDVSQFVKLMTNGTANQQFAVRGGGHTLWSGAANIATGITIDMRSMNNVVLTPDHKVAQVDGGNVWDKVYDALVPYNLTALGGRIPGIGIGGFTSGGGITFQSREHGFSCDNVVGYEVVLGSGDVVYASASNNSDLWLGLKGGSNNFGIITRFDVATVPQEKMWYGLVTYPFTDASLQTQAKVFSNFMNPAKFDSSAMMGVFLDYAGGQFALSDALWYTKPTANPPVYQPFTSIANATLAVSDIDTVDNVVIKFGESIPTTVGRGFQLTYSFQNAPADVYFLLFKLWQRAMARISKVDGIFVEFLIQPHPVTNGTNLFGLTPGKTDDVMVDMTSAYNNAADDNLVQGVLRDLVNEQQAVLRSRGLMIDFIYLNYADKSQKILQSWGQSNIAKMQAVSKKYDPNGVFQKQVPGGVKISQVSPGYYWP